MKLLMLTFLFCCSICYSQTDSTKYFNLNDTTFEVGAVYLLENITFDFDASRLQPQSKVYLDSVVQFLEKNFLLSVEIGCHTDLRGNNDYNEDLTERRAKSVVSYLHDSGISKFRLNAKGFGENKPFVCRPEDALEHDFLKVGDVLNEKFITSLKDKNQKEICHQLNRRTEMKIRWIMSKPQVVPIIAEKVLSQKTYVIPDIRFDLGRADIMRASHEQLDLIVAFMQENPSVIIEVGNHCDCRASSSSSTRLTQKRADSIVAYLVNKGIAAERLVPKGYFKNVPPEIDGILYTCEYINKHKDDKPTFEDMQQKRRRTELKVLSTEYYPTHQEIWKGILQGGPIPEQKYTVIPDIVFDFDKSTLRPKSLEKLDTLVLFLENNPSLVIEIANHLDCRGDRSMYSTVLSQRRADAIVDYLISKGIARERLVPKGYEDGKPLIYQGRELNCEYIGTLTTEEQEKFHVLNRRTEFRIIAKNYVPPMKEKPSSPLNMGGH